MGFIAIWLRSTIAQVQIKSAPPAHRLGRHTHDQARSAPCMWRKRGFAALAALAIESERRTCRLEQHTVAFGE
jgi:hypothetical protein